MSSPPHRRLTMRARLTLSYAGLVTVSGAVLITIVYLYMRFTPINIELYPDGGVTDENVQSALHLQITLMSQFLSTMFTISLAALAGLTVLSGAAGWATAGRILTPLTAMGEAARKAASGDLDHPIALTGPHDEIRDLADTFDRMLASLDRSFEAHRRFAANASHELRTPLATTQTMIDVTLANPDATIDELKALVSRIRETNRSHVETIDALFDLAHAQSGDTVHESVDLSLLARLCLDELAAVAREQGVRLNGPAGRAMAWGDPVLLRQGVSNLLRNAVWHNVPGGAVEVLADEGDGQARLTIRNDGEMIPVERLESLREPFVRGSGRVRTRDRGHGLGLAIVSAVAEAHDGDLCLSANQEGGLTAVLTLPAVRDEEEPGRSA